MRIVLFILFFFSCVESFAQCSIAWIRDTSGLERSVGGDFKYSTKSIVKITEQATTKDEITGPDQFSLSISLLDSLAYATDSQHPPYYTKIKDSAKWRAHDPDVRSYIDTINLPITDDNGNILWTGNFKLFKMLPRQIVHYDKQKYFLANDSFVIHQFAYCDSGWEWNEDYPQNYVFYTKEFGVIKKEVTGGMTGGMFISYWLYNNSCLSDELNKRAQQLIIAMKIHG